LVLGSVVNAGEDVWPFDEFVLDDIEDLVGLLEIPDELAWDFLGIKCEVLFIEVHVFGDKDVAFFLNGEDDTLVIVESWVDCFIGGIIGPFLSDTGVVSLTNKDTIGSSGFWSKSICTNLNSHLLIALWNQIEAFTFLYARWIKSFNLIVSVEPLLAANKLEFVFKGLLVMAQVEVN